MATPKPFPHAGFLSQLEHINAAAPALPPSSPLPIVCVAPSLAPQAVSAARDRARSAVATCRRGGASIPPL